MLPNIKTCIKSNLFLRTRVNVFVFVMYFLSINRYLNFLRLLNMNQALQSSYLPDHNHSVSLTIISENITCIIYSIFSPITNIKFHTNLRCKTSPSPSWTTPRRARRCWACFWSCRRRPWASVPPHGSPSPSPAHPPHGAGTPTTGALSAIQEDKIVLVGFHYWVFI